MTERETGHDMRELQESVERMAEISRQREVAQPVQLPMWPEPKRGTPNSFLRSALFSAIQGKDRQWLKGELLASQDGITVKYTGQQLNQEDLTLWETLVHMARQTSLGDTYEFTAYSILKTLGLPTGGEQHEQLHEAFIRLAGGVVEIEHGGGRFFGTLIDWGIEDKVSHRYRIQLNRQLIKLYQEGLWTYVDWRERKQLRNHPLALALHGFYSSHRKPYPMKIETLHKMVGSRNKNIRSFKQQTKAALDKLVSVKLLDGYSIEGDVVMVNRNIQSKDGAKYLPSKTII